MISRPKFIVNESDVLKEDNHTYPGSQELFSQGAPVGSATGLQKMGIHIELLHPGRRISWPHADCDAKAKEQGWPPAKELGEHDALPDKLREELKAE